MTAHFSLETMRARRYWNNIFKVLESYTQWNYLSKNKGKKKKKGKRRFQTYKKMKESITSKLVLQDMGWSHSGRRKLIPAESMDLHIVAKRTRNSK